MSLTLDKYTKADESIVQILIGGSLDTETAQQFDTFVAEEIEASAKVVILDMKDLSYVSSAGIRSVFKLAKRVKANKGKIAAANRQPQIEKVFDIVKALPDMQIFRNDAEMDEYLSAIQKKIIDGIDF
ncbi:MAG: STAS domain-containing protein [Sinobacterium sp.]|nr:STAS domain-containing protein [Sinobacterium sp.]